MEGFRNVFGEIEYELGPFFVPHRTGSTGQYAILKHESWYVTDPVWYPDGDFSVLLWVSPPLFDSFIQAVAWLKAHYHELA